MIKLNKFIQEIKSFKKAALDRAKEFDITNILPLYERFYEKIISKQEHVYQPNIKNTDISQD